MGLFLDRFIDPETDAASQATGSFRAPRYYGARQARAERDRGLKRLQLGHAQGEPHSKPQKGPAKLALPLPGFIPLDESDHKVGAVTGAKQGFRHKIVQAFLQCLRNIYIYILQASLPVADVHETTLERDS